MRFSVRHLLMVMAILSAYLAIVFAVPGTLSALLLALLSILMPAIYMGGVAYSRRAWRAFWIGTMSCGILPTIFATYCCLAMFESEVDFADLLQWKTWYDSEFDRTYLYYLAACHTIPLLGGLVVVTMRRIYKPTRSLMPMPGCCLGD